MSRLIVPEEAQLGYWQIWFCFDIVVNSCQSEIDNSSSSIIKPGCVSFFRNKNILLTSYMMRSSKKPFSSTHFPQNPCRFCSFGHSGPLVEFSMISWHQRRRRRKPWVNSHLSLETRATFRRGDAPKSGGHEHAALLYRAHCVLSYRNWICIEMNRIPITIGKYTVTSRGPFLARNFTLMMSCSKGNLI